jgi:hypothetical protein
MDHLPAEVKREVNDLLLDPRTRYRDIRDFLKTQGYDVSAMCVCRYGRRFMEEVREMRAAGEAEGGPCGEGGEDRGGYEERQAKGPLGPGGGGNTEENPGDVR